MKALALFRFGGYTFTTDSDRIGAGGLPEEEAINTPTLIIVVIIVAVVTAFSVQNAAPVAVSFLFWHFEASLAVVVVLSVLSGLLAGMALLSWFRLRRARQKKTSETNPPHMP